MQRSSLNQRRRCQPRMGLIVWRGAIEKFFFHPLTYIKLALSGIPAIVRHGEPLAMKMYKSGITPVFPTF
jgi:hypothetical protein